MNRREKINKTMEEHKKKNNNEKRRKRKINYKKILKLTDDSWK